ncbi:MAG: DUF192 domain-containing protein [Halobacteriota archaeon]|jgi:hypothetical protein
MRVRTPLLIVVLCGIIAVSTLSGCVTTLPGTPTNTSSVTTAASGSAVTNGSSATTALKAPTTYRVTVGSTTVYAEAADTPAKREMGLMNRTYLNEDAGMLFIFPTQQQQTFWMKNMRIPLDIVFITADNHVLEIYASVPPCTSDPCALYTSSAPIQYALEVNSGFCSRNGIASGDPVVIAAGS